MATKFCCEALSKEVEHVGAFAGGGFAYPDSMRPTGQIEQTADGSWAVNGCCGGGCYVLQDMRYCPFCGSALPSPQQQEMK